MKKKTIKYLIVLGDGMADYEDEGGQTPLTLAKKPFIDGLVKKSELGLVQTVPKGMSPGSDTANLSVMGYDPKQYYTGRSPLEAASIGINLSGNDVTYRLNLVTLSDDKEFNNKTMLDYSAGEITTKKADKIIKILKPYAPKDCELYTGTSYRHCLVYKDKKSESGQFMPPHDITDKVISNHLPPEPFCSFIKKSHEILKNHPQNDTKCNSAWIWGAGTKPMLTPFKQKFGVSGAVISEVDLIKGIGICAKMQSIDVDGADGSLDTNYEGMVAAAIKAFGIHDFVYLHIEAPDECGHKGDKDGKILSIEYLDNRVVEPLLKQLEKDYHVRMLFLPDHATPLALKTHTSDPVPYMLYDSKKAFESSQTSYTEQSAAATKIFEKEGHNLISKLFATK